MNAFQSTSQQRGLLLLAIISGVFLIGYWWIRSNSGSHLPEAPKDSGASKQETFRQPPVSVSVNTADSADFDALPGIGRVLSSRIIRFRNSLGGCFTDLNQISEVYGLKDSTYQLILPYLILDPCTPVPGHTKPYSKHPDSYKKEFSKKEYQPVDLNIADSASLENLPGIGSRIAGRIIRFRNALGFFHSTGQLSEVYGFADSLRTKALPYLFIGKDLSTYPHLHVNSAGAEDLGRHPYLGMKTAGTLVKYRSKIGRFHNLDDLGKVYGLDSSRIEKLQPYIVFE